MRPDGKDPGGSATAIINPAFPVLKITISSPDGLGDFVLRVPLLRALLDNGHRLQLFMRRPAADLAREIFPETDVQIIGRDPYHPATKRCMHPFRAEHQAIRKFQPDLYVAALFHLNFFDQVWLERGWPRTKVIGFSAGESFRPSETTCDPEELARRFDRVVEVVVNLPEIEKNRRLASAILEKEVVLTRPVLTPSAHALSQARDLLARHGLEKGKFWVSCVGTRSGLLMKDWGEENWAVFFRQALQGYKIAFVGNTKEWASIERIRHELPDSVNLSENPPEIGVSSGICSLSAGYVGRDSGIMHLTAAVGRPVFAVFGAGHWGRFLPAAENGVVVAQDWPCRGSNFHCPHDEPYCIRDVPLDLALEGWRMLQAGGTQGLKVLEAPLDQSLLPQIARTASLQYARLTQESRRRELANSRPKNLLDAIGLKIRSWAGGGNS